MSDDSFDDPRCARAGAGDRRAPTTMRALPVAWLLAVVLASSHARATTSSDPPDEWGMTRERADPVLADQRMHKLARDPFSSTHWRALQKQLGATAVLRRVQARALQEPAEASWTILLARAEMEAGQWSAAADRLLSVPQVPSHWNERLRQLTVEALLQAARPVEAIDLLLARGDASTTDDLERALAIASQRQLEDRAYALAQRLADLQPSSTVAQQRLAELATARRDHVVADRAWHAAIESAAPRERASMQAKRAEARLDANDPEGALELLWALLENRGTASAATRRQWWRTVEQSIQRGADASAWGKILADWVAEQSRREPAALHALATVRVFTGEPAVEVWRESFELDPRDELLRLELIRALEGEGRVDELSQLVRALDFRSEDNVEFALSLASRLTINGERDPALSIVDLVGTARRRDGAVSAQLLEFYNSHGETERALAVGWQWVNARPRDPEARVALGEQLFEMNAIDEAIEQWKWLPRLTAPAHAGWARLAEVFAEHANAPRGRGLRQEALSALERALKEAPRTAGYYRLRAILEEERRAYDDALASWIAVRSYARGPDESVLTDESRTRIVELLVGIGLSRREEARAEIERDAQNTLARGNGAEALAAGRLLADLYAREEKYDAAVDVLRRIDALAPGDPQRMLDLALALRRAGSREQLREAVDYLQQVAEIDPRRRAEVLAEMSELAFMAGDNDTALAHARTAAALGSQGGQPLVHLGELHERQGELDRAVAAYNEALTVRPRDARAGLRLAELRLLDGDIQGALHVFETLVASGASDDIVQADGRRLLDVAEATGRIPGLVDIAIERANADPQSDTARELVLEVLERMPTDGVQEWLHRGTSQRDASRVSSLRRILLSALARGSIGVRMRAAELLAPLDLPDTAVPLARVGANLSVQRDTSAAIAQSYERARVAALLAAGTLDDQAAVPVLHDVATRRTSGAEPTEAAVWALANASTPDAAPGLEQVLAQVEDTDARTIAVACLGLARVGASGGSGRRAVARHARNAAHPTTRHACAYAEVRLLPRGQAIEKWVEQDDAVLTAIALAGFSKRMVDEPRTAELVARRAFGPTGLIRDAALAAISHALRNERVALAPIPMMDDSDWSLVVRRWLVEQVTHVSPIEEHDLVRVLGSSLVAGAKANLTGTSAEQIAMHRLAQRCDLASLAAKPQDPQPTARRRTIERCLGSETARALAIRRPSSR